MLLGCRTQILRRRLAANAGAALTLAGWLAFEDGDSASAYRYWDSALTAAELADDGSLWGCLLICKSYTAVARGDVENALVLCRAALPRVGADARTQAWAFARCAQVSALADEGDAALTYLAQARSWGLRLGPWTPDEECKPWSRAFDASVLAGIEAGIHTALGNIAGARVAAEQAVSVVAIGKTKTHALVLAQAACAFAASGECERAVMCANAALDLLDQFGGVLAERTLRSLTRLLTADAHSTTVGALLIVSPDLV